MAQPDQDKLNALLGRMVGDLGAIGTGALVVLGDRLGLFKAMAAGGKLTAGALATATGTHERYIREWLCGQAAAGYVEYDADDDRFWLSPEQAMVFADEDSPAFMAGAFEVMASLWIDEPKVSEVFRSGLVMKLSAGQMPPLPLASQNWIINDPSLRNGDRTVHDDSSVGGFQAV